MLIFNTYVCVFQPNAPGLLAKRTLEGIVPDCYKTVHLKEDQKLQALVCTLFNSHSSLCR